MVFVFGCGEGYQDVGVQEITDHDSSMRSATCSLVMDLPMRRTGKPVRGSVSMVAGWSSSWASPRVASSATTADSERPCS